MIKQRMVELNYSRICKSYTIELKHKETNTGYLVQEVNIQTDWLFITKIHINKKHKPINYPNYPGGHTSIFLTGMLVREQISTTPKNRMTLNSNPQK